MNKKNISITQEKPSEPPSLTTTHKHNHYADLKQHRLVLPVFVLRINEIRRY